MNEFATTQVNTDPDTMLMERFALLPSELTDLIEYKTVALTVNELATAYTLTKQQQTLLENEIILVLLLFLPRNGFKERVQESLEINGDFAEVIADDVQREIFSLVDGILSVTDKEFESGESQITSQTEEVVAEEPDATPQPEVSQQQTEAAPTEQSTPVLEEPPTDPFAERVAPLRTMQSDASRIHGYGAYRRREESKDAPETKEKRMVDPPRYNENG